MELVLPSEKYKASFIEAIQEFRSTPYTDIRSERYSKMPSTEVLEHAFETYIQTLVDMANGNNLPEGYVSATDFWLVDGLRYIGCVSIRHQLNDHLLREGGHIGYDIRPSERGKGYGTQILKLALPEAKRLGIHRILITCDATNDASRKIIEKNAGVFEDEVLSKDGHARKRRYWIEL